MRFFELFGCLYGNKIEIFRILGEIMVKLEWMVVFLVGYYDVDGYIGMKLIGGKKFYFL